MNIDDVCHALCATLSSDISQRRNAEAYLDGCSRTAGFSLLLLQLVQQNCITETNGQSAATIRSSAAVYFKNLVNKGWEFSNVISIAENDRGAIKTHIVKLVCLCGAFGDVKQQLSQALTLIAASDFPAKWPDLLPEIVQNLRSSDKNTLSGMLLIANSVLKRFRHAYKSDALYGELKYVLDALSAPLTALFLRLGQELNASSDDGPSCALLLDSLRLACRVFFSLNWQDLPEFFEDHIAEWMGQFELHLAYENSALQRAYGEEGDAMIERMQAAIVDNASLYAHKYEEEFSPYLPRFVSAIWQRLVKLSLLPKHDRLAAASIRFLAEVIGKQMHTSLFAEEQILRQVIEAIVIPNMNLRNSDLELFEDCPLEYISQDLDNADSETRRRGACDLINAMCKHHKMMTMRICSEHINCMLKKYASSPADHWRAKDAALHLVVALAFQTDTHSSSSIVDHLNVMDIYSAHVAGELIPQSGSRPIILADAIQYVCAFRNQLPPDELIRLLPLLGQHLSNTEVVVQSYAAVCLERILASPGRINKAQLKPILSQLYEALFAVAEAALTQVGESYDVWENEHAMKALMRLLVVSQDEVVSIVRSVADKLCVLLRRTCINPRNPKFNHYLFESLAILVRIGCGNHESTAHFEKILFPPFEAILQMDVVEFAPYVFQILALLLGYRISLSSGYASLLPPLLHPSLWERRGNVPALTALLEAYLVADAEHIVLNNQLEPLLGVFQKLLASKLSESYAFELLNYIILQVEATAIDAYIPTIIQLLMTRLQHNRGRTSFGHKLLAFFGLFAGKRGGANLANFLENQQAGLLPHLILHVFTPLSSIDIASSMDSKFAAIGATRILCEAPDVLTRQGDTTAWSALAAILFQLLRQLHCKPSGSDSSGTKIADDIPDNLVSYDTSFSKLHFASKQQDDPFIDVQDVQKFSLSHLQQLAIERPYLQPLLVVLQHKCDAASIHVK
mmetsp:Transcript_13898/g.41394  ORF Transcript_13898/g.41394 Transcript_13898/m.41394 type:complete len:969 (+) Transcript_13898:177-3083(+)